MNAVRDYAEANGVGLLEAKAAVAKARAEERTLIKIAKLSGIRLRANNNGEHTLAALIGVLLDAEVNS